MEFAEKKKKNHTLLGAAQEMGFHAGKALCLVGACVDSDGTSVWRVPGRLEVHGKWIS